MRLPFAALMLVAAAGVHAQDRDPAAPCSQAVRFRADWFADPEVDLTTPSTKLLAIGRAPGNFGTTLGLVTVDAAISVAPEKGCRGLVVQLKYLKPVLRVASELPRGSCGFEHVIHHEYTHVRIWRDIARQFRELSYPWPDGASTDAVLRWSNHQFDKMREAQRLFDSPEEYAGNTVACKGEIPRLLAAARPGK